MSKFKSKIWKLMLRQKAQQKCERVEKFQKLMLRFLAQQSAKGLKKEGAYNGPLEVPKSWLIL